jgi:hypothetical protein
MIFVMFYLLLMSKIKVKNNLKIKNIFNIKRKLKLIVIFFILKGESNKTKVVEYYIESMRTGKLYILIDTPGFMDTRGVL